MILRVLTQRDADATEIGLLVGLSVIYVTFRLRPGPAPPPLPPTRSSSPGLSVPSIAANLVNGNLRERATRPITSHSSGGHGTKELAREKMAASMALEGVASSDIGGKGCVWGTEEREYRYDLPWSWMKYQANEG